MESAKILSDIVSSSGLLSSSSFISSNLTFTPEFSFFSSFTSPLVQSANFGKGEKKKTKDVRHPSPSFSSSSQLPSTSKRIFTGILSNLYEYFGPFNYSDHSVSSFLDNYLKSVLNLPLDWFSSDRFTKPGNVAGDSKSAKGKNKSKVKKKELDETAERIENFENLKKDDDFSENICFDSISRLKYHVSNIEENNEHIIISILMLERMYGLN
jgi:hypothetical protein